jgi:hypothetical protein
MALQRGISAFDYERALSNLETDYAQTQGAGDVGRFLGQQRFSRQSEDMTRGFNRSQPQFGGGFARRGMMDSGMYKQGLSDRFRNYGRAMQDMSERQMESELDFEGQVRQQDLNYQLALLQLNEMMQAGRAGSNPFDSWQNPLNNLPIVGGV